MKLHAPELRQAQPPHPRADRFAALFAPAVVDVFAGVGGWSIGAEQAFVEAGWRDRYIDLMINHWDTAVAVHQANHPLTEHLHASVFEVDPEKVLPGRRIAYAHFSPDCVDFSKAKGGRPKRKEIRALADVVIVWAGKRRPDVITLENVEEFRDWGPLGEDGQPDKALRGTEFRRWVGELEALGYEVEWRELRACDYGAPTTRKRLFVIARCDGKPIIWPEKTHGPNATSSEAPGGDSRDPESCQRLHGQGRAREARFAAASGRHDGADLSAHGTGASHRAAAGVLARDQRQAVPSLKPYRTAAECIDWSLPMLSIFASRKDARAWAEGLNQGKPRHERLGVPQRPLRPKTQKRIAGGLLKWVLEAKRPFIISPSAAPPGAPDRAAYTSTLNHGEKSGETRSHDPRQPMTTVTSARDARGLVAAELAGFTIPRHGERYGQEPRSRSLEQPLPTVTGTDNGAQLVAVALNKHFGGVLGQDAGAPLGTVTGVDHHSALAAYLAGAGGPAYSAKPRPAGAPLNTIQTGDRKSLVGAHLIKFRGESVGHALEGAMPTITAGAGSKRDAGAAHAMGLAACYLSHQYTSNACGGQGDPEKPARCITSGGQHGAVCVVCLAAFYGSGSGKTGHSPGDPLPTVPSHDRFGMVAVDTLPSCGGDEQGPRDGPRDGPREFAPQLPVGPHWVFAPPALRRARRVANWARAMLGRRVEQHLLWVLDPETNKKFALLIVRLETGLHVVMDIAMRMLRPRELARAQGFPEEYVIERTADGRLISKADQVKLIGNSVPPQFARAIVRDNVVLAGVLDETPAHAALAAKGVA